MSRRLIERSIPLDAISAQSARRAVVVQGLERRLFGYGLGDGEELDFDALYPPGHRPAGPVQEIPHSA